MCPIQQQIRAGKHNTMDITKDYKSTDFSPGNYDFRFVREEDVAGQRCYVLESLPKNSSGKVLKSVLKQVAANANRDESLLRASGA